MSLMRWSSKLQMLTTSGSRSSGGKRCLTSKSRPSVAALNDSTSHASSTNRSRPYNKYAVTGEYAPVYIVMGFVTLAVGIGIHSVKQQLLHSPGVSLKKTRRGSMSEADNPDLATANAHDFLNKSFLRKVGRIQQQQDKN
ncbi:hypothetical protein LINGRAHAP2_LOCUS36902 [Linum grandiflorum]